MKYFLEGFVGSFKLAADLVLAVVKVATDFVRYGGGRQERPDFQVSRH